MRYLGIAAGRRARDQASFFRLSLPWFSLPWRLVAAWVVGCVSTVLVAADGPPLMNLELEGHVFGPFGSQAAFLISEPAERRDLNADGDFDDQVLHVHDIPSVATRNLGLAVDRDRRLNPVFGSARGDWIAFDVSEAAQGQDLNGDGDTEDHVLHSHHFESSRTTNHGFSGAVPTRDPEAGPLVFSADESEQGGDRNGDGDQEDTLLVVGYPATGETVLVLPAVRSVGPRSNRWLVFDVSEATQGQDLNGDGDTLDAVLHAFDFERRATTQLALANGAFGALLGDSFAPEVSEAAQGADLNGDGDTNDWVVLILDLRRGTTRNPRLASRLLDAFGNWVLLSVSETAQEMDLNEDGDQADWWLHVHALDTGETTNLRLPPSSRLSRSGSLIAFPVGESAIATDLNGDGDLDDEMPHLIDLATGVTASTRVAMSGERGLLVGRRFVFYASELSQQEDLNGDGDLADRQVIHVHDVDTSRTLNLRVDGGIHDLAGHTLVFTAAERSQAEDLNGDGDLWDDVIHVHDLETSRTENLRLVVNSSSSAFHRGFPATIETSPRPWFSFEVSEFGVNEDLNGDGDLQDAPLHLRRLDTSETVNLELTARIDAHQGNRLILVVNEFTQRQDIDGNGDRSGVALLIYDLEARTFFNPRTTARVAAVLGGRALLAFSEAQERLDLNGSGHVNGEGRSRVVHVMDLDACKAVPAFLRGDCNADGDISGRIGDAIFYLDWAFRDGAEPPCRAACDVNGDGSIEGSLADVLALLNWAFGRGRRPLAPLVHCGSSLRPQDLELGCETPVACP